MSIFRGAFTALITPMKADGSVDFEGFRKNVKHHLYLKHMNLFLMNLKIQQLEAMVYILYVKNEH